MSSNVSVVSASLKRHASNTQMVQATVDLGVPNKRGEMVPYEVKAPVQVWYELSGGTTFQGEMKATAKSGRYRHNHVNLAGTSLRLVIKLVTDSTNVEPIYDQSLPVA